MLHHQSINILKVFCFHTYEMYWSIVYFVLVFGFVLSFVRVQIKAGLIMQVEKCPLHSQTSYIEVSHILNV